MLPLVVITVTISIHWFCNEHITICYNYDKHDDKMPSFFPLRGKLSPLTAKNAYKKVKSTEIGTKSKSKEEHQWSNLKF